MDDGRDHRDGVQNDNTKMRDQENKNKAAKEFATIAEEVDMMVTDKNKKEED